MPTCVLLVIEEIGMVMLAIWGPWALIGGCDIANRGDNFIDFSDFFLFKSAMADNMPDQFIEKAFGDIPEEKLLQEAGLSFRRWS